MKIRHHSSPLERSARNGLTLTELLVVVSIIVIVSSALIPMMQPVLRGQNTREASRQLNVVISGVQATAISDKRPRGIWLERAGHELDDLPERLYTVHRVYRAEQPSTYTGDFYDSRVLIVPSSADPTIWEAITVLPDQFAIRQVRVGDFIRFDHRGPQFPVVLPTVERRVNEVPAAIISFGLPVHLRPTNVPPPIPTELQLHLLSLQKYVVAATPVAFEVFRQPTKDTGAPIELPNNVGIDLSVSGYASPSAPNTLSSFREIHPEFDIVIMLSPEGGVERVYYISHEADTDPTLQSWSERPPGNISLLLARDDKIGRDPNGQPNITLESDLATRTQTNAQGPLGLGTLEDKTNIWLSISGHSGRVHSGTNAGVPTLALAKALNNTGYDARTLINGARQYADTGQSMGGR